MTPRIKSTRTATTEEWDAIVTRARAAGALNVSSLLQAGEITFITPDGEELVAPSGRAISTKAMHGASVPIRARQARPASVRKEVGRLSFLERHRLMASDPKGYAEVKAAERMERQRAADEWTGLSVEAQRELYRTDRPRAVRLMTAALEEARR